MTGHEFSKLIAAYIVHNFSGRGVRVYLEVPVGKSIIGKDRRVDIFVLSEPLNTAIALECKCQNTQGTADEKIPYTLSDMAALHMPGHVVYAGDGFSEGVLHMLRASEIASYCLPNPQCLDRDPKSRATRELDHILAMTFRWWDILVDSKKEFGTMA